MFLRNYWYVAGYDHEVGRRPLARVILGEPVVLYRLEDGMPVALEDRCAHRHLPLSMGKLVGDTLQCHYHGLRYDKGGVCVRVPGQDTIPRAARVKSYPVVERYRWLWIWMGDPAQANPTPSLIFTGSMIRPGGRRASTSTSSPTGSSSSTTCSISPISPSCMTPRSATPRWSIRRRSR